MLNDHERETLLNIERQLQAEEPRWAQTFDDAGKPTARRRAFAWTAHIVGLLLAIALTVLMVAAQAPGPALFFALVSGLLIWLVHRLRRATAPPDTGEAQI